MKQFVFTAILAGAAMSAAAESDRKATSDDFDVSCFQVEIEGVAVGTFTQVEGLEQNVEAIEYQGNDDLDLKLRPGRTKFGDITLSKTPNRDQTLIDWWQDAREGKYDRRSLDVSLSDDCTPPKIYAQFPPAWSVSGSFDGKSTNVLSEEVTLIVERMELE